MQWMDSLPPVGERNAIMFGKKLGFGVALLFSIGAIGPLRSSAQEATDAPGSHARIIEVTGNNVYVRSGPTTNHYPVCKLNAGDRTVMVSERGGWYEIVPPAGAFSLISGDYVDTADGKRGVVNGDNVRVRAGSSVPAFEKSRYTIQTKVSKGHELEILERLPDGFLRIVPPEGATVWIHGEFVAEVPADRIGTGPAPSVAGMGDAPAGRPIPSNSTTPDGTSGVAQRGEGPPSSDGAESTGGESTTAVASSTPLGDASAELARLDKLVEAELEKPIAQRAFKPMVPQYEAVGESSADPVVQGYVARRVDQLRYLIDLTTTLQRIERINRESESRRRELLSERSALPSVRPSVPGGFAAKGELRASALYRDGAGPARYRLVDATVEPVRTIGYVELPADSRIVVEDYLGRFVGVRASSTRLQEGGVDPIPIYTAAELVELRVVGDDAGAETSEPTP